MRLTAALMLLAGCASLSSPLATPEPKRATVIIDRSETGYVPIFIEVEVGTIVTWHNTDRALHTVTYSETADPARNVDGTFKLTDRLFNFEIPGTQETVGAGGTASYSFATAGTYHYFCLPHDTRMRGTVVVR